MHQDDANAHALNQCQVLHNAGELTRCDGFTGQSNDQRLTPVHVNVGGYRPKPRNKCEVENVRHGSALGWLIETNIAPGEGPTEVIRIIVPCSLLHLCLKLGFYVGFKAKFS